MSRIFVILACVCAVAYAQFGTFGSQQQNSRQQSRYQTQQQPYQTQPQTQYQTQPKQQYQTQQQSQYQTQQQQNQQPAAPRASAGACRELNERYPVSGSCDRYIECINGTAEEKLCPDGLLFNANVNFNAYPCQYPNEVSCLERSALQPAQPTDLCPHQFGYYKLGDASNCSHFRNCVNGVGYDFTCPEGLAYNTESYRCDWPDQVADCDAEAFLGFRCPEVPISKELGEPAGYRFYRSDTNCQKYFLCIEGRPRVLSCGGDTAFDDLTSTCVSADEVSVCPQELRTAAARAREEEKQLLAKEIEFNARPINKVRRPF